MAQRFTMLVLLVLVGSFLQCGKRLLVQPGVNTGVHNQKLLSTTIHKSVVSLQIPFDKFTEKRCCLEVLGGDEVKATICNALYSLLDQQKIKVYPEGKADIRLVVGADYAGINQHMDGAPVGMLGKIFPGKLEFPYLVTAYQSHAKTNLYAYILDLTTGEILFKNTATASSTDNVYKNKICALGCFFPALSIFDDSWSAEE